MTYSKHVWTDGSGEKVSATNLNEMEAGIYDAHIAIDNVSLGHDHDGVDSKKVTSSNVINVPAGNISSVNIQSAINELDGQDTSHAALTGSTHGITGTFLGTEHKDVNSGIAILDSNGNLLSKGSTLFVPRSGSEDFFIGERTSSETVMKFLRSGENNYVLQAHVGGLWKNILDETDLDAPGGAAKLDTSGNLLSKSYYVMIPRSPNDAVYLYERTSEEYFTRFTRLGSFDYKGDILESNQWRRIQTDSMKDALNGIAKLGAEGSLYSKGPNLLMTRSGDNHVRVQDRTSSETLLDMVRSGTNDWDLYTIESGVQKQILTTGHMDVANGIPLLSGLGHLLSKGAIVKLPRSEEKIYIGERTSDELPFYLERISTNNYDGYIREGTYYRQILTTSLINNNQSFTNLLENGNFESWSGGASAAPDSWVNESSEFIQEGSTIKIGTYSIKASYSSSVIRQDIPITRFPDLAKQVTFGMWVKSDSSNSHIAIHVDGLSGANTYHSGGGGWEFLTATRTLNSGTNLQVRLYAQDTTNCYGDGAILVEGTLCPTFSPKPLIDDGITGHSHTPSSASDYGKAGQWCYDSNYFYVCYATNTWARLAHSW